MKKRYLFFSLLILLIGFFSCDKKSENNSERCVCNLDPKSLDNVSVEQKELDYFYSLMAYAVVYKDWQRSAEKRESRGYNIGSVLVNSNNRVVHWARNCVNRTLNETQHGEVRLMQSYLDKTHEFSLKGYTIYTTLEPCAMCSGMMKLTELYRTVYGQTDPAYGKALERLQLESATCCEGGYSPYPRPVISDKSPDSISVEIDLAYRRVGGHITQFLTTKEAEVLFRKATKMFMEYTDAKYPQNQRMIDEAHEFYIVRVEPVQ
ncbi:nucleoside deaminase [Prolixibacteraceae bacterium JC049]|nr:nucleoside deaminase [Prolixibacteraceae bacterium JC049]